MPISVRFSPKSVQKCGRTSHAQNEPHALTSRTLFRMDFARTRTRATAHRTCACAHAPSQLIPCILLITNYSTFMNELKKLLMKHNKDSNVCTHVLR